MKILFLTALQIVLLASLTYCQTADDCMERGHSYLARHKLLQAESMYLQAIAISPQLAEAHERLGKIYQDRKMYSEATTHYKTAMDLGFNQPSIYIQQAFCQQKTKKLREAVTTYQTMIDLYPEIPEAYLGLGGLYERLGEKKNAEAAFNTYRVFKQ